MFPRGPTPMYCNPLYLFICSGGTTGELATHLTNWETFDWVLEVKKKESLVLLRHVTFPDIGKRELTTEQKV